MRAIDQEALFVAKPLGKLVSQRVGRVDHPAAAVADNVDVLVVSRPVCGRAVAEMGVPDKPELFEQQIGRASCRERV